jgi:hypothetical protein
LAWPFDAEREEGSWHVNVLSQEWGVLNIAATPLQHCVPATVTITADHVVEQWRGVDANSVGVEVQFVMWTRSDGSGQPCSSVDDCTRAVRRAPLRWVGDGASMEASLTPDPSVDHYVIVVTVHSPLVRVCSTSAAVACGVGRAQRFACGLARANERTGR